MHWIEWFGFIWLILAIITLIGVAIFLIVSVC